MGYWSRQEIAIFRELNFEENKKARPRKTQWCYNSGRMIEAGEEAESVKVYPSSFVGRDLKLSTPKTFYKCGTCGECTH